MLGHTLHLVSSHYTAGWRKHSGNAWENDGKRRKKRETKKERGKRPDRHGHDGTLCRTEEKKKL